jgi:5'-nucleotidase
MRILLTNDDGIAASGLQILYQTMVAGFGADNVTVVAPDREQSACSHAITLHKALRVREVMARQFAVNGTPADCVSLAVSELMAERPQMVISGINRGPNLGTDIGNSGTVSGALQSTLMGLQAIAVSLAGNREEDFSEANFAVAALVAKRWVAIVERQGLPPFTLLNINVPASLKWAAQAGEGPPSAITAMGMRQYQQKFERRTDPRGRDYYWNDSRDRGGLPTGRSDSEAIAAGKVSITPIQLDQTNHATLELMRHWQL